jgi:hypothetical protein
LIRIRVSECKPLAEIRLDRNLTEFTKKLTKEEAQALRERNIQQASLVAKTHKPVDKPQVKRAPRSKTTSKPKSPKAKTGSKKPLSTTGRML